VVLTRLEHPLEQAQQHFNQVGQRRMRVLETTTIGLVLKAQVQTTHIYNFFITDNKAHFAVKLMLLVLFVPFVELQFKFKGASQCTFASPK
jgi:hypothetical protein